MVGQCSKLARKTIAPLALRVEAGTLRGLPRCRRAVHGAEEQRQWHSPPLGADALGEPDGVRRVDEPGCVKKGQAAGGHGSMVAP
jgi:hypothetical protein